MSKGKDTLNRVRQKRSTRSGLFYWLIRVLESIYFISILATLGSLVIEKGEFSPWPWLLFPWLLFASTYSLVVIIFIIEKYHNLHNLHTLEPTFSMELITYFAGLQAFTSALQVWQNTKNREKTEIAYFRAKNEALTSNEVKGRADKLNTTLRENPVLMRLLESRFGRCEDKLEKALRSDNEEKDVAEALEAYAKCKCLLMQGLKKVLESLDPEMEKEWDVLKCDVLVG